jgi:hypothetical protein
MPQPIIGLPARISTNPGCANAAVIPKGFKLFAATILRRETFLFLQKNLMVLFARRDG